MSKKTLGQIAWQAQSEYPFSNTSQDCKDMWERIAQAVATAVRAESQWQPIETAPREWGIYILAYGPRVNRRVVSFYGGNWYSSCGVYLEFSCFTHWQPLPAAPNETKE